MTTFGEAASHPPKMDDCSSIVLFVLSILFPGLTQMVFALVYRCDAAYFLVGFLMFITSPFLIGWVWSIAWGARGLTGFSSTPVELANNAPKEDGAVTV